MLAVVKSVWRTCTVRAPRQRVTLSASIFGGEKKWEINFLPCRNQCVLKLMTFREGSGVKYRPERSSPTRDCRWIHSFHSFDLLQMHTDKALELHIQVIKCMMENDKTYDEICREPADILYSLVRDLHWGRQEDASEGNQSSTEDCCPCRTFTPPTASAGHRISSRTDHI